jgi:hypothetical protein
MYESEEDLSRLQEMLDQTFARANPHPTSIVAPERRPSACQVARYLQRTKHVALATVNARGEPHMDGDRIGIAVHGRATVLEEGDAGVDELDRAWTEIYGSSPSSWGEGVVFMEAEPSSMWAYAFHPEGFPE